MACFGLALLAKSIAVGLPLVLLGLDRYPLARRTTWGRLLVEKLPFVLLSAAVAVLTVGILASRGLFASHDTLSVFARLALAAYGLVFYTLEDARAGAVVAHLSARAARAPVHARVPAPGGRRDPDHGSSGRRSAPLARRLGGVGRVRSCWWLPSSASRRADRRSSPIRYSYLACVPFALLAGASVTWSRRRAAERQASPLSRLSIVGAAAVVVLILSVLTVRQIEESGETRSPCGSTRRP